MLAATGIRRGSYAPPLYRLLWEIGVPIPPPYLSSFRFVLLTQGIWFGICWGVFIWWSSWAREGLPTIAIIAFSTLPGLLFGLMMATNARDVAKKHKLPNWSEIPEDVEKRFD